MPLQIGGANLCKIDDLKWTGCGNLNSVLCYKSRAGYTEIGNKEDYIYCYI